MHKSWYASVNYGLESTIAEIIKPMGAEGVTTMDSALTFACNDEIKCACFINLFRIVTSFKADNALHAVRHIIRQPLASVPIGGSSFRIIIMDCGQLCSVPDIIMREAERKVAQLTNGKINRANPETELWVNRRNDGNTYFMARVHKHASSGKVLKQGELRPDIAHVMLHLAKADKSSVIADPFCGWGAIAAAAAESRQYQMIHTGDIDAECLKYQRERLQHHKNCTVHSWDARSLPLPDGSIDAIVTDPPWGEFKGADTKTLYDLFLREAARVLKPKGKLVLLTSAQSDASRYLKQHKFSYIIIPLKINGKETFLFDAKK